MNYTDDDGFVVDSIADIIEKFRILINESFNKDYSAETFRGTNFFALFYNLSQIILQDEIDKASIFEKLLKYTEFINKKIDIPKISNEGLISILEENGFLASIRENNANNAGILAVCIDVDNSNNNSNYASQKQTILNLLAKYSSAGLFFEGTEIGDVILSNGQTIQCSFYVPNKIATFLKATITISNQYISIGKSEDGIKDIILENISKYYSLGRDFEPSRILGIRDIETASNIILEYKNSETSNVYTSNIYHADFRDFFTFSKENIEVVIL